MCELSRDEAVWVEISSESSLGKGSDKIKEGLKCHWQKILLQNKQTCNLPKGVLCFNEQL